MDWERSGRKPVVVDDAQAVYRATPLSFLIEPAYRLPHIAGPDHGLSRSFFRCAAIFRWELYGSGQTAQSSARQGGEACSEGRLTKSLGLRLTSQ